MYCGAAPAAATPAHRCSLSLPVTVLLGVRVLVRTVAAFMARKCAAAPAREAAHPGTPLPPSLPVTVLLEVRDLVRAHRCCFHGL
jgi:hypothetical protein